MTIYPVEFHRRLEQKWLLASTRFSPSQATRHHREIPTMTMMTSMKTKRTKTSPTSRPSSANPMKTSGYRTAIASPNTPVLHRESQDVREIDLHFAEF